MIFPLDCEIGIKLLPTKDGRYGLLLVWHEEPGAPAQTQVFGNRADLWKVLGFEVIPKCRGDLPTIDGDKA